jgi:hypothetical protein
LNQNNKGETMITPTAAPRAARNQLALPEGTYFPPLTLVAPPGAAPSALRRFIVQISPLIHRSMPLPPGLDAGAAERYVRAFAQSNGQDCCVEYAGSGAVYFLADGTRFLAGR